MARPSCFTLFALWLAANAFGANAPTAVPLELEVRNIPAGTTEIVVLLDGAIRPPGPEYNDGAAPVAAPAAANAPLQQVLQQVQPTPANPAAQAAAAAAPAPAAPEQRRRRGRGPAGPPPPPTLRESLDPKGATTATLKANLPVADGYQARVIALRGDGAFPTLVAGGRIDQVKINTQQPAPLAVSLQAPTLRPDPQNPTTVKRGALYQLRGVVADPARALGTRNRMRVWITEGAAPTKNFSGAQTTTVDVTTEGDDVTFTFDLKAPDQPGTLYYQFGELPPDFARADERQAPFIALPDLNAGGKPLALRVE